MKINRTFSIDYDLAQRLRNKPNQSEIVCKSVRRYLSNLRELDERDISTKRLLLELSQRDNIPNSIKLLVKDYITSS
jgi:hypothetical protein